MISKNLAILIPLQIIWMKNNMFFSKPSTYFDFISSLSIVIIIFTVLDNGTQNLTSSETSKNSFYIVSEKYTTTLPQDCLKIHVQTKRKENTSGCTSMGPMGLFSDTILAEED